MTSLTETLQGKTIESITEYERRAEDSDDPGLIINFTDGTSWSLSAVMGLDACYLVEEYST